MIKITGQEQIVKTLNKLLFDMNRATIETVFAVANSVRNTAVLSIQNQSPGHVVARTRQGGSGTYEHMAADRGNAPNTDTGNLVRSIAVEHKKGDTSAFVGTSVEYGAELEFGGWAWLEPAMDQHKSDVFIELDRALTRQIEEV